ncbi:hypothetical protein [Magnetococcus marinus]|nr:hypothetical protein [Magnetococcus marinus]
MVYAQQQAFGAGYLGQQFGQFMRGFTREMGQPDTPPRSSPVPRREQDYGEPSRGYGEPSRGYGEPSRGYGEPPYAEPRSRRREPYSQRDGYPQRGAVENLAPRLPQKKRPQWRYDPWGVTHYGPPPPESDIWFPWPPNGGIPGMHGDWYAPEQGALHGSNPEWSDPYGRWSPDSIAPPDASERWLGRRDDTEWMDRQDRWSEPGQGWPNAFQPWQDGWDGGLWHPWR